MNFIEGGIAERVRETVEVAEDVGARRRIAVYADCTWELVDTAADVEYAHKLRL